MSLLELPQRKEFMAIINGTGGGDTLNGGVATKLSMVAMETTPFMAVKAMTLWMAAQVIDWRRLSALVPTR